MPSELTYIWDLKNKTNEHRPTERTNGWLPEERELGVGEIGKAD